MSYDAATAMLLWSEKNKHSIGMVPDGALWNAYLAAAAVMALCLLFAYLLPSRRG